MTNRQAAALVKAIDIIVDKSANKKEIKNALAAIQDVLKEPTPKR